MTEYQRRLALAETLIVRAMQEQLERLFAGGVAVFYEPDPPWPRPVPTLRAIADAADGWRWSADIRNAP